jgi:hypothetical protein
LKAWNKMEELDFLPPSSQYQHYLWATCIYAYVPPQWHHSLKSIGGERPKDYTQVHVAIYRAACWIGEFCCELIAFVAFVSMNYHSHFFDPLQ